MSDQQAENYFNEWINREGIAERMVPVIGNLYRENGVVVTIFGRSLVRNSPVDILKAHRFARHFLDRELPIELSSSMLEVLGEMQPTASRVDIGKLALRYQGQPAGKDLQVFLKNELRLLDVGKDLLKSDPRDVVLYGFGRIGRMLARILIERSGGGDKWRLRAIVVHRKIENDLEKRASLLRRDSIHGPFRGTVQLDRDENALVVNGNLIRILYAESPEKIDYVKHGIENAIVVDNSGVWRDRAGLAMHLKARGADKVILTAPGKGDIPNIIYGVNNDAICPDVETFQDLLPLVKEMLKGKEKNKLLLYCTGGIRCEKASAYLKHHNFKDVNQLHGGIISYAHQVKERNLECKFKGKNFVFDFRMGENITDDIISNCHQCENPENRHTNCFLGLYVVKRYGTV